MDEGEDVAMWFSEFLGTGCSLVRMPDDGNRSVNRNGISSRVSFVDAFPLLLISEGSLADLNTRLEVPIPMKRFRPNLVVSGAGPYAEDSWRRILVGGSRFHVVKSCARCAITTVDPETGTRGKEPLRTLATYREVGGNVMFGQNLVHEGRGVVSVGDSVVVEDRA
jgi:uncharacterized protein YcbX